MLCTNLLFLLSSHRGEDGHFCSPSQTHLEGRVDKPLQTAGTAPQRAELPGSMKHLPVFTETRVEEVRSSTVISFIQGSRGLGHPRQEQVLRETVRRETHPASGSGESRSGYWIELRGSRVRYLIAPHQDKRTTQCPVHGEAY